MDIKLFALQNAIRYGGKANPKAVLGQTLQKFPELKKDVKGLMEKISKAISEIEGMSIEEMKAELEKSAPELLEKKVKEKRGLFDSFNVKNPTTAFPPEPSKYPHIGHAKAIIINYEFAKQKDGKFILRFEDTNPTLAKKEFYDIHLDNYEWLGIKPDKIEYASDYMEKFYKLAEKMIAEGKAYVCTCAQEKIKENRMKGIACGCRDDVGQLKRWKEMQDAKEGSRIVRARIDIAHKNSAMRDPALMRIIDAPHVRTGTKYRLWPAYDFENSVMDGLQKITNRFRSKEFELRNELQRWIQSALGFENTDIREFARFNMSGVESSGRIIREKIEKGELSGWDDPSLTTLVALRRRGFTPKAIWDFVLSTGITKSESTLTWDDLIKHNKRVLDKEADRFFFVKEPTKIVIKGAPEQKVSLKKHPEENRGYREFSTKDEFYITKEDMKSIENGKLYRLMDCLNFRKDDNGELNFVSRGIEDYRKEGKKIFHWLPAEGEQLIETEIRMPDNSLLKGFAEKLTGSIKEGEIVQFERFGFCRLDSEESNTFWYTHK